MKNNLYVIQFKVEKSGDSGVGPNDNWGDDDGYDSDGDNEMEELDHEDGEEDKGGAAKASGNKESSVKGPGQKGGGSNGRKVASWAGLFQDEVDSKMLEESEIEQYSCTKLLREMEALEVEDDDDEGLIRMDEDEVVNLPEGWAMEIPEKSSLLPESRFVIPEIEMEHSLQSDNFVVAPVSEIDQRRGTTKWGHILVEKRPCKNQRDGKTMMEKA
jgi:hypothetical protein